MTERETTTDYATTDYGTDYERSADGADIDETGGEDAARLEAEIAATRDEMTGTVEAIGDRLDPGNIVQEAKNTVRDATVGKVGEMTSTATEALSGAGTTVQETGSGLVETIKQNPIPAALAGAGIAWLWTHRAQTPKNDYGSGRYRQGIDAWDTGYGAAGSSWSGDRMSTSEGIGDKVGDVTDEVGRRVSQVGDKVGQLPDRVGGGASGMTRQAQQLLEESPLAVGAVAMAVGAAISMALPVTQTERRVIGPKAGQMLGQVEDTATEALQKVQDSTNV
jgi:hypothetical protein